MRRRRSGPGRDSRTPGIGTRNRVAGDPPHGSRRSRRRGPPALGGLLRGFGSLRRDDRTGLAELIARDGPEAAFVADVDGHHAGSVLLVRHELSIELDHTPWLAGLVVAPDWRGRGVGASLVRAIEVHAFAQGFEALYLYTHDADAFYAELGWTVLFEFTAFGEPARLMVRRR